MALFNIPNQQNFDTTALEEQINGKAPLVHEHEINDVNGLQEQIDSKATVGHEHLMEQVDGLLNALYDKADKSSVNDALTGKAAVNHTHVIDNITGLQTALNSKANASDVASTVSVLEQADVSLQNQINNKSAIGHGHQISDVSGLQAALNAKANLGTNYFTYDQSAIPSNPVTGDTWRERYSNGKFLKDWEYDGTDWLSLQDYTISNYSNQSNNRATAVTASANTDNYFLDGGGNFYMEELNKGILIKNSCLHLGVQGTNDLNNYWRVRLYYFQTGNVTILPGELFTSDLIAFRWYNRWLSHERKIYRGTTLDSGLLGMRGYFKAFGTPTNLLIAFTTSYRIIR